MSFMELMNIVSSDWLFGSWLAAARQCYYYGDLSHENSMDMPKTEQGTFCDPSLSPGKKQLSFKYVHHNQISLFLTVLNLLCGIVKTEHTP